MARARSTRFRSNRLTRQTHYSGDLGTVGCRLTEKRGYRKFDGRRSDTRASGFAIARETFTNNGLTLPVIYVLLRNLDTEVATGASLQMHRGGYNDFKCLPTASTQTEVNLREVSNFSLDGEYWKSEVAEAPYRINFDQAGNPTRIQSNKLYLSLHDNGGESYACCRLRHCCEKTWDRRKARYDAN